MLDRPLRAVPFDDRAGIPAQWTHDAGKQHILREEIDGAAVL
jgi:hypothetical protein